MRRKRDRVPLVRRLASPLICQTRCAPSGVNTSPRRSAASADDAARRVHHRCTPMTLPSASRWDVSGLHEPIGETIGLTLDRRIEDFDRVRIVLFREHGAFRVQHEARRLHLLANRCRLDPMQRLSVCSTGSLLDKPDRERPGHEMAIAAGDGPGAFWTADREPSRQSGLTTLVSRPHAPDRPAGGPRAGCRGGWVRSRPRSRYRRWA